MDKHHHYQSEGLVSFHQQKIMALGICSTIRQPHVPEIPASGTLWFQFIRQCQLLIFFLFWLSLHLCLKIKEMFVHNSREGEEDLHLTGRGCDTLN